MTVPVAAIQMCSQQDVDGNLARMAALVSEAAHQGCQVVLLPENFAFLGPESGKRAVAEPLDGSDGPIVAALRKVARQHELWLVAGGMPERSDDSQRPYNTCVVLAPDGSVTARYRKIHLFDVELDEKVDYTESVATTAGSELVVTDVAGMSVGLSICYDLRFPELYRQLTDRGAQVLMVPAAFTVTTGKDHWHVLLRARAIEAQAFVIAAAQWGRHHQRTTYGKSCIIDPWGEVITQASEGEGMARGSVDLDYLDVVRRRLPALRHRRL